ncbi:MAG TPA: DUF6266 family protein [Vicingaceae bacterium]|nr:DUF6266 family protein [Vicingaceae bacterium]
MARQLGGIMDGFSGTIGNIIGYRWRGQDFIRSRPSRTKKRKPTKAQKLQREKFAMVMQFLNGIREVVDQFYGQPEKTKSRFNLALSYHLKEAVIQDSNQRFAMDYQRVLVSMGELREVEQVSYTKNPGRVISLSWVNNSRQGNAEATDLLHAVVYCPRLKEFRSYPDLASRASEWTSFQLPLSFKNKELHLWVYMTSLSKKEKSLNTYLGVL